MRFGFAATVPPGGVLVVVGEDGVVAPDAVA